MDEKIAENRAYCYVTITKQPDAEKTVIRIRGNNAKSRIEQAFGNRIEYELHRRIFAILGLAHK